MKQAYRARRLYGRMVRAYAPGLYRYAYRSCGNAATAEDLVSETFTEAWRSMHTLRSEAHARAWLFQILRHRYARWSRERARRLPEATSLEHVENVMSTPVPDLLTVLSRRELLQAALDALEDRYKEPFLMVLLEGLSCRETAKRLDVPLGTVLSRIHRARTLLREHLRRSGMDEIREEREGAPGSTRVGKQQSGPRFKLGGES